MLFKVIEKSNEVNKTSNEAIEVMKSNLNVPRDNSCFKEQINDLPIIHPFIHP